MPDPLVYDRPEFSSDEIALIRGLLAEKHRTFHHLKTQEADQELRDSITGSMHRIEDLSRKLGELL